MAEQGAYEDEHPEEKIETRNDVGEVFIVFFHWELLAENVQITMYNLQILRLKQDVEFVHCTWYIAQLFSTYLMTW
jgi:hypothetical protein